MIFTERANRIAGFLKSKLAAPTKEEILLSRDTVNSLISQINLDLGRFQSGTRAVPYNISSIGNVIKSEKSVTNPNDPKSQRMYNIELGHIKDSFERVRKALGKSGNTVAIWEDFEKSIISLM